MTKREVLKKFLKIYIDNKYLAVFILVPMAKITLISLGVDKASHPFHFEILGVLAMTSGMLAVTCLMKDMLDKDFKSVSDAMDASRMRCEAEQKLEEANRRLDQVGLILDRCNNCPELLEINKRMDEAASKEIE